MCHCPSEDCGEKIQTIWPLTLLCRARASHSLCDSIRTLSHLHCAGNMTDLPPWFLESGADEHDTREEKIGKNVTLYNITKI